MVHEQSSVLVALAICISAGAAQAQTPDGDASLGTWRLNVERSVWTPGPRAPADAYDLRQYAALADGWYRFVLSGRNAAGNPTFEIGVFKLDGHQYPRHNLGTLGVMMTNGTPVTLTRSYRVIDQNTVEFTNYTDGVAGSPVRRQIAPDGMTFTQISQGTTAQGVQFRNVLLFERVN